MITGVLQSNQSNHMREIDALPVVLLEYLLLEEIKLPKQLKKYLSGGVNKQELIDFLLDD